MPLAFDVDIFYYFYFLRHIIMTSAFIAISKLKQINMTEKQLTNFLSYLSQEVFREYLSNSDIYKGKYDELTKDAVMQIYGN